MLLRLTKKLHQHDWRLKLLAGLYWWSCSCGKIQPYVKKETTMTPAQFTRILHSLTTEQFAMIFSAIESVPLPDLFDTVCSVAEARNLSGAEISSFIEEDSVSPRK